MVNCSEADLQAWIMPFLALFVVLLFFRQISLDLLYEIFETPETRGKKKAWHWPFSALLQIKRKDSHKPMP